MIASDAHRQAGRNVSNTIRQFVCPAPAVFVRAAASNCGNSTCGRPRTREDGAPNEDGAYSLLRITSFAPRFEQTMPPLPRATRVVAAFRIPSGKSRAEYFDSVVPGLTLRMTHFGVKTWTLQVSRSSASPYVGAFPGPPARGRATTRHGERGRIAPGVDPALEKRLEHAAHENTLGVLYDLFKAVSAEIRSWPEQRVSGGDKFDSCGGRKSDSRQHGPAAG